MIRRAQLHGQRRVQPVAAEELAGLHRRQDAERSAVGGRELHSVARELVVTHGDGVAGLDLERLVEHLAIEAGLQLERVACIRGDLEKVEVEFAGLDVVAQVRDELTPQPAVDGPDEGAGRAPPVAPPSDVLADPAARHEPQGRVEIGTDLRHVYGPVDAIVGVVELEAPGDVVAGHLGIAVGGVAVQEKRIGLEYPVAEERAGAEVEIGSDDPVVAVAERIAGGDDETDRRLIQNVERHAADGQQLAVQRRRGIHVGAQKAEVPSRRAPGKLRAGEDAHRQAVLVEADAAREEGQGIEPDPAEPEYPRVLEEEAPLLRKEKGEAREVDAALVDLGLGEVGVEGERQRDCRREPVAEIQAAGALEIVIAWLFQVGASGIRPDVESQALRDLVDAVQNARVGDRLDLDVA